MMPIIFVLCVIGSYSLSSRLFDVYTMLGFGTLVFIMRRNGYPAAPFVLGLVLGDILDKNLRRGLVLSDGDLLPFFSRPHQRGAGGPRAVDVHHQCSDHPRRGVALARRRDGSGPAGIPPLELTTCASHSATR